MSYLTISPDILIVVLAHVSVHWTGKPWHLCCSLSSSSSFSFSPSPCFPCSQIPSPPIYPHIILHFPPSSYAKNYPNYVIDLVRIIVFVFQLEHQEICRKAEHLLCHKLQNWFDPKLIYTVCRNACSSVDLIYTLWKPVFLRAFFMTAGMFHLHFLWTTPRVHASIFGPIQWRSPDLCRQPKAIFMSAKWRPVHSPLWIKEALVLSLWNTPLLLHCLPKHSVEK